MNEKRQQRAKDNSSSHLRNLSETHSHSERRISVVCRRFDQINVATITTTAINCSGNGTSATTAKNTNQQNIVKQPRVLMTSGNNGLQRQHSVLFFGLTVWPIFERKVFWSTHFRNLPPFNFRLSVHLSTLKEKSSEQQSRARSFLSEKRQKERTNTLSRSRHGLNERL